MYGLQDMQEFVNLLLPYRVRKLYNQTRIGMDLLRTNVSRWLDFVLTIGRFRARHTITVFEFLSLNSDF